MRVLERDDQPFRALAPKDEDFDDYVPRAWEFVCLLARVEERLPSEVLQDIVAYDADILEFKVEQPLRASGTIDLQSGVGLVSGAKRTLVATAESLDSSDVVPEELIKRCSLATRPGSFIAEVRCFIGSDGAGPDSIFPIRKVTAHLMRLVEHLSQVLSAPKASFGDEAHEAGLTRSLVDAVSRMKPESGSLTISSRWAYSLKPEATLPEVVRLAPDQLLHVPELARQLKRRRSSLEGDVVVEGRLRSADFGRGTLAIGDVEADSVPGRIDADAFEKSLLDGLKINRKFRFFLSAPESEESRWLATKVEALAVPRTKRGLTGQTAESVISRRWSKTLTKSDARVKTGGRKFGFLRLARAGHRINHLTWFRQEFFVEEWETTVERNGGVVEETIVRFGVEVLGEGIGDLDLRVTHAEWRGEKDGAATTRLHWGSDLTDLLDKADLSESWVVLERRDREYTLRIQEDAPEPGLIGPESVRRGAKKA